MEIKFNILTYKRDTILTLDKLKNTEQIDVWCMGKEAEIYRKRYKNNFQIVPDEIEGNVARVRNYILENCNADWVYMLDDDISYFQYINFKDGRPDEERINDFNVVIDELIKLIVIAETVNCPVVSTNGMSDKITANEKIYNFASCASGACIGVKKNTLLFDEKIPYKEDYDISLQSLNEYGCCIINKYMQVAHKMWCKGGCAEERTIEVERENIRKFVKKWGNAVYESNRKRTKNNYVFPKVKISAFGLK